MNFNFPLILVIGTAVTGFICLIDILFFAKARMRSQATLPIIIDYSRSFFPVLLIVLLIRSFLVQPFRVPTGSLEPTVLPGDFVVVNQFAYGLRLPVWNTKILSIGEPKLGDIAVFRYPENPKIDYVKRVIGTPGDHIIYANKILTINGKTMPQRVIGPGVDFEPPSTFLPAEVREEDLMGVKHQIFINKAEKESLSFEIVVPPGQYFMMGDNRDNSADSRSWGYVPEENLVGKAVMIWLSWDSYHFKPRFSRIGNRL